MSRGSAMKAIVVFMVCAVPLAGAADEVTGKRVALVVGNGAYTGAKPLRNPANDAKDMASALRACGFAVTVETDCDYERMDRAVEAFGNALRGASVSLFYYAGHGMQVQGENYLLPVDARLSAENEARYRAINAGLVLAKMESAGTQLNIVILDACRHNPFGGRFRSATQGLATMEAAKGTVVAFATAPGQAAQDGSGRNGVFTEALLRYMRAPGLELRDVLMQTRIEVAERTGDVQVPWENTSVMGRFYFVPGAGEIAPVPVVTPAPIPAAAPLAGERRTVDLGDGVSLGLVWIPPGEFLMGSPEGEEGRFATEGPQHRVRISRGFWMGIYEVTNAQYARYKPDHASGEYDGLSLSDPDQPVVQVSWEDAVGFADWVSRRTGETFRLPTEAEWEYACRAGSTTPAPWGRLDATTGQHANVADRTAKARWSDWSIVENVDGHEVSAPAGTYRPNGFGLHDMIGNVWEWCEDDWHDGYTGAPSDGTAWVDAPRGLSRVLRGGGWFNIPGDSRSAIRGRITPEIRISSLGFRVVLPAVQ